MNGMECWAGAVRAGELPNRAVDVRRCGAGPRAMAVPALRLCACRGQAESRQTDRDPHPTGLSPPSLSSFSLSPGPASLPRGRSLAPERRGGRRGGHAPVAITDQPRSTTRAPQQGGVRKSAARASSRPTRASCVIRHPWADARQLAAAAAGRGDGIWRLMGAV